MFGLVLKVLFDLPVCLFDVLHQSMIKVSIYVLSNMGKEHKNIIPESASGTKAFELFELEF